MVEAMKYDNLDVHYLFSYSENLTNLDPTSFWTDLMKGAIYWRWSD